MLPSPDDRRQRARATTDETRYLGPHRSHRPVSPSRGIPTSRAYWELKAEQMLNRVFSGELPIEVEIVDPAPTPAVPGTTAEARTTSTASTEAKRQRSGHALAALLQRRPELVPISIATVAIGTALTSVGIAGFWGLQQQALRQERNLVLLERLRALGPGSATNASPAPASQTKAAASDGLPPPPPDEPWMEELAQLPAGGAPPADVLKVPFTSSINQPAPASQRSTPVAPGADSSEGLPLLVGVVQIPGRNGSAIFQIGGSSTNATVGESIGGSGWRLRSASGDSAVIERGGQVRRISISSGF